MNQHLAKLIPDSDQLVDILHSYNYSKDVELHLNKNLIDPVADFFHRPGKNVRPRLVQLGYRLAHDIEPTISFETECKIQLASAIVEMIHGGSLIVDDIQDGSLERRDGPSFHLKHGLPLALNAGNWLYFQALNSVKSLDLSMEIYIEIIDSLIDLMGKAHMGQALDLGVKINELPQHLVKSICLTSMKLKTGTITSLALKLGMGIAESVKYKEKILTLGRNIGLALQMFDDFGNFHALKANISSKRYEDLYNKRPTWIWALASDSTKSQYQDFCSAVEGLPNEEQLLKWVEKNKFTKYFFEDSQSYLLRAQKEWNENWKNTHPDSIMLLEEIKTILENSYVKKT